ncbi:MAG: HYR domain-containing protein [Saprospiraceae bacterium]|nr:HYR domain-containing protein [Saprospiraceae bacterium]
MELGFVNGGLEPYTIQYSGAQLDLDSDGIADDSTGMYVYNSANGYDETDFTQFLGDLLVNYTQPVWSFTIVDARGCELFQSGSCDIDDATEGPTIPCMDNVDSLFTETYVCESQYTWMHPLPFDNCKVVIYDYQITNPDGSIEGPFDLVNLLNIAPGAPLDARFEAEYEFTKGISTVMYYAEDAVGLWDTCSFTVEVIDDDPPVWQNCPRLPIVENAETGHCDAYVNFSAPYAIDNCADTVTYRQIDNTGLNSGSRFPVGTTILIFEAEDECGNIDTCEYKIIVNDYWETPIIECRDSVYQINDLDECGAEVFSLAPMILDSCAEAIAVTYVIEDENGDTVKVGSGDASGSFFPVGLNQLTYNVQDQPHLMITEVTQQLMPGLRGDKLIGGTDPKPGFLDQDDIYGDYIEITNFGPAAMDVSCLQVNVCVDTGVICEYIVPNLTVIPVGEVLTLRVGSGVDDTTNLFFNMGCLEADINEPRGYTISLYDRVLDVVTTNGFDPDGCGNIAIVTDDDWVGDSEPHFCSGSYYRKDIIDHNDPRDWIKATSCSPATIGSLNPILKEYVNIWNGDTVSLQSVAPGIATCNIPVLIEDVEKPTCVEYDTIIYSPGSNLGTTIECGDCFESVINVPTDLLIGDINVLNLMGTAEDIYDLDVVLISPEGKEVRLFNNICNPGDMDFNINLDDDALQGIEFAQCNPLGGGGTFAPQEELKDYYLDNMMGDWTLQISNNSCNDAVAVLDNWELQIMGILPYSQGDTILPNDPGECSAEFCWIHPILEDNCCVGTIDVEYIPISPAGLRVPRGGRIVQGSSVCEIFDVGRTLVKYTLVDQYGNMSMCSFEVEVDDVEDPMFLNCPGDQIVHLDCGLCDVVWEYPYRASDNCFVDTIIVDPPNGTLLPIGDTTICVIAIDSTGNADTCKYNLSIREYQPLSNELSCVDDVNLSLDQNCIAVLNADMILEGCNHRCYDNYELEIVEGCGNTRGQLHSDTFTLDDVGKCFNVTVIDPVSGNSCWGCVCIEEKLTPELACPPDDTISCIEPLHPDYRGYATLLTCDPAASINYVDSLIDFGDCEDWRAILYRKWRVVDADGNKSRCIQTIHIEAFDLNDIVFPRNFDDLDRPALDCGKYKVDKDITPHILDFPFCVDGYLLDSAYWFRTGGDPSISNPDARDLSGDRLPRVLGWNTIELGPSEGLPSPYPVYYNAHPQWAFFGVCWGPEEEVKWHGTGVPTIEGVSLYDESAYCDISVKYEDDIYELCGDGYGVLRHWKVWDLCKPTIFGINPRIYIQTIKVTDTKGPEIQYPDEVTVGTDAWNCYSMWDVPEPWLTDNCSSELSYSVVVWDGRAIQRQDGSWYVEGLPLGEHRVVIEARDKCGNTTQHEIKVTVIDDTPPVAICKDKLQLSLTGNQTPGTNYSAICAEDLDKASYDNCTDWVWFKMIRMDELLGTVNGSFADNTIGCGGINGDDDAIISGNQVYFDDCSKFCCDDANDTTILVVLRVHDVDPGAGPVNPARYTAPAGDLVGRFTDCWVEIEVVDKAQPLVVAPPDMVVSCMFWFDDSEDALSDPDNPTFGRVVTDLNERQKVKTTDIVCEEWCEDHPKYDYEPSRNTPAIWSQACDFYNVYYNPAHPGDKYELVWGFDGYAIQTCGVMPEIRVDDRRECGQGVILRDVIVSYQDAKTGGVVTFRDRQEIWVIDCDPFYVNADDCFDDEDCIEWPLFCQQPDPLEGCGADLDPYNNPDLGYPVVANGCDDNCALIAIDYQDEYYSIEDTACFKVIRTWVIIDWCQYDPLDQQVRDGDNPNEVSPGRWEYVQSIVVRDKVDPVVSVEVGDCEPAEKDSLGVCHAHLEICAEATDDCSPDDWLVYDYKIDAYSDGVGQFGDFDFYVGKLTREQAANGQVLSQGPTDCEQYNQGGYCNPFADDPTQPFCASGTYPVGTHTFYFFAEDGCGNVVKHTEVIEVLDCKEPTPYCKTGIITVVMPATGEICVWANDLNDGSFDNCTDTADLKYYFNGDPTMTSYCINCDSFVARGANGSFRVEVEMWVEDEEGNADYCVTTIEFQDNQDVCPNTGSIANVDGAIRTKAGDGVEGAEVDLMMNGGFMRMEPTDAQGHYAFSQLDMYNDYVVKPRLDKEWLNGVSTKDLVLIQRHLLGKQEFTDAYQTIAADVNLTESVTAGDISSLRKVILGLYADFSEWDNTSWKFVDADQQFANIKQPWPLIEELSYPDVDDNMYDSDFVGVKVGDVSGDARANGVMGSQTRGYEDMVLRGTDETVEGEYYVLRLDVTEDMMLSGYQFTLDFDAEKVSFDGVVENGFGLGEGHTALWKAESGKLLVSWNATSEAHQFYAGEAAVLLRFRLLEERMVVSETFEISSDVLIAEAYDEEVRTYDIKVDLSGEHERFALYQNVPNPFADKTVVGFELPTDMPSVMTIYDTYGQIALILKVEGKKGYNEIEVSEDLLGGSGVYYYQLDAEGYTQTKRMIFRR